MPTDTPADTDDQLVDNAFHWTSPTTGQVFTIASTAMPRSGFWRRARKLSELDAMYELLETVGTPEEIEATDDLEPVETVAMMAAWLRQLKDGGAEPGESSGSSA